MSSITPLPLRRALGILFLLPALSGAVPALASAPAAVSAPRPAAAAPVAGPATSTAATPAAAAPVAIVGASRPVDARQLTTRLYAGAAPPRWLAEGGVRARPALRLLRDAQLHGLDPALYGAADLARRFETLSSAGTTADPAAQAAFERDLSTAMLQFLADLHYGRAPSDYPRPPEAAQFDPVAQLRRALADKRIEGAVDGAAPTIPLYGRVRTTLAEYRKLAGASPSWPALPPLPAPKLVAGDAYDGAPLLHERLRLLGDLDAKAAAPGHVYTAQLAEGVKRFQARHALGEDGVLGAGTVAALSVPLTRRVAQLELTLERLRWLPPLPKGRVIAVNLPTFRLWAFDGGEGAPDPLEMRVIVGTAAKTPTPLFIGQLRYLEFNPYWNVPRSIEVGEILPKLARNPGYLAQHDMELVSVKAGAEAPQDAVAALRAGTMRVRQRPGSRNVLGAVKFAMPNPMNIYLHSTAAKELFNKTRRDLSHGCIRVERPADLARFVLNDSARWNAASVEEAMKPGKSRTVSLKTQIPVVLFYTTALSDYKGRALFGDDIYNRDTKLIKALQVKKG